MGIISFIKGGVGELAIARPDSAKDQWVYKHPDQTIPMKAQLTVDSDEVALFFKDGKFVGSFSAGRHTLDASNIPFLGQLVDKFTGGNVFICEVFFVTTRELASIKFGTSIGDVQDPQTQLRVRIMVHGEFSARVIDPAKLVIGLVGQRATTNEAFVGWFKSQVQKTMKDGIAELIVKQSWPMMKVTSGAYTDEIEDATLQGVRRHIEPYGVEIIRFGDFSITMDQADKERLDKLVERMAYVNASGGMAGYQQLAQAEMMMGAAEGMKKGGDGGGGAFQGAGIGMGFAMAGQMAGMMGNANAQQAQPAPESRDAIMATLKQLGELKAAGILTETEFETKKKELLAKL
jgi:membrane protease subunit (stomatin/prohibitin family)